MAMTALLSENSHQGVKAHNSARIGLESKLSQILPWGCGNVYDETSVGLAVYVRNDPVNFVDRDGKQFWCVNVPGDKELGISGSISCMGWLDPPSRRIPVATLAEVDDRKPPKAAQCTSDKRDFFEWLGNPLNQMAEDLNVNRDFLFALAAKEGGWTLDALNHNMPLNNPFGVNDIKNGQAIGNKKYDSVTEAIKDWEHLFGERVRGAQSMTDFINGLQNPQGEKPRYNSADPQYAEKLENIYLWSIPKYKEACRVK